MPDLDFSVRAALDRLNEPIPLPALYDRLTPDQRARVREEYARRQGGRCCYCQLPLSGPPSDAVQRWRIERRYPPNFFKFPHHLHHNHVTGLTIGTAHARCNAVLFERYGE